MSFIRLLHEQDQLILRMETLIEDFDEHVSGNNIPAFNKQFIPG